MGAIILTPSIGSALAAKKTFYNLDAHRDQALHRPPDLREGIWIAQGFVADLTVLGPGEGGYDVTKGFCNFAGAGAVESESAVVIEDHDYFFLPVSYQEQNRPPASFQGMSGGGLWPVPITRDEGGKLHHRTPLLSGVVFYQERIVGARRRLKCHGRSSVYQVAYDVISGRAVS